MYRHKSNAIIRSGFAGASSPDLLGAAVIMGGAVAAATVAASERSDVDEATIERLLSERECQDARVVVDWNELGWATAADVGLAVGLVGHRTMPMMHLAMHDALNAIVPVYDQYSHTASEAEAHPVAAVSQAAHDVLANAYPDHAEDFARLHESWLDEIPEGERKAEGIELGAAAAASIIADRDGDGYDSEGTFTPGAEPGAYRYTPPFDFAAGPGWGDTRPLGMNAPDQFRPGPPPDIGSAQYAEEFNEVKRLGREDSQARTEDQTHSAHWWAEYTTVGYPDFVRARIAEDDIHLWPAARLFALLAMDNFDALISAWDAKYEYQYWRPYTAIRQADADGNPATGADSDWAPEMTTPPHPDYPAALSTCAGGAEMLKDVLGPDVAFSRESGSAPEGGPATRVYETVDDAVESCMLSRIYNGFHFRSGLEAGVEMGRDRAHHILDNHLTPRAAAAQVERADF